MPTSIGDLVVNLKARSSPFDKSIRGSQKALGGFRADVRKTAGAIAGLAGVGGFALMIKSSLAAIDSTAKLARQIGASTQELSALGFAAEQSGASVDVMNSALLKMSRRVGLFAKGSGAAKSALTQLGFSARSLIGITAGAQFKTIIAEISKLKTESERGAAAFEIFGNAGQQLLGIIDSGPAGLKQMTDEAKRLGLTFNAMDAAKVEQANDALNSLKRTVGGLSNSLTIRLAPAITDIINKFTGLITLAKSVNNIFPQGDSDNLAKPQTKVIDQNGVKMLLIGKQAIERHAAAAGAAVAPVNRLHDAIGQLGAGDAVQNIVAPVNNLRDAIRGAANDILILQGRATATGIEMRKLLEGGDNPREVAHLGQLMQLRERLKRQQEGANAAQMKFLDEQRNAQQQLAEAQFGKLNRIRNLFDATRTPAERLQSEVKGLLELLGKRPDKFAKGLLERGLKAARDRFKSATPSQSQTDQQRAAPARLPGAALAGNAASNRAILGAMSRQAESNRKISLHGRLRRVRKRNKLAVIRN
jgi:hypothetical protein